MRNTSRANVRGWLALALPALLPAVVLAEPLLLQAPDASTPATSTPVATTPIASPPITTYPAAGPAAAPAVADAPGQALAPASAPSANPLVELRNPTGKILILPFQAVNPNDPAPWMGRSIQESMVADLTVAAPSRVVSSDQVAGTLDAAVALGKQNNARFVIAGGFVTANQELRITGQVVDVETGKAVAGLKATGDPAQIFHLEDTLALEVRGQLLGQQVTPMEQAPGLQPQLQPQSSDVPDASLAANPQQPQQQQYSPYAFAPTPTVYGDNTTAYTYYPSTYVGGYDPYYYPAYDGYYGAGPYYGYGYGYGLGCYPFGFGLGCFFGNGFYGRYNHSGFRGGYGYGYGGSRGVYDGRGRTSLGVGVGFSGGISGGISSSNFRGGLSISPGFARSAARVSSAPFRSSSFSPSSSFGRTSSIGGFRSSGGFSAHASFGGSSFHGGGGFSHGGGGGFSHGGGGGGHGGGGHR